MAVPDEQGRRLSPRERQVITLVASGLTTREIGLVLGVRPCTVDAFVRNAKEKLHARTRIHAFVLADGPTPVRSDRLSAEMGLTAQQRRLLQLLAQGYTMSEAAERLHVSLRTAHRRLRAAREAMGVRSNAEALTALGGRRPAAVG